jgi:rubrerythrin
VAINLEERRRFVATAGLGGVALAIAPAMFPMTGLISTVGAQAPSDVDIAAYAQSIELAMVAVYGQVAGVLSADGKVVGELFARHHQEHADEFGALAGARATGQPNAALIAALAPRLQTTNDQAAALELAFVIENQTAATYAFALTSLSDAAAIVSMATILPIETEHAAVLGIALQKSLVDIFPNAAFEAASVGEAGSSNTGLDPAKYPVG